MKACANNATRFLLLNRLFENFGGMPAEWEGKGKGSESE